VCLAQTDHEKGLVGRWEYRQAAGTSFDREGEILEVSRGNGSIRGVYFGLEREGEHGLYYTAIEVKNLTVSKDGEVTFTVPTRELFRERPKTIDDTIQMQSRSAGFTRDELQMKGSVQGGRLILRCDPGISCPAATMVFQKGTWRAR
jgi:hypothetical protein